MIGEFYQYKKGCNKDNKCERKSQDKEKWKAPEEGWVKMNCDGH